MGISPRRLWGWEPEQRLVRDGDGWKLVTEPEFDKAQYEYLAGLEEYEESVDDNGFPLDEVLSPLADPDNPDGTHYYESKPVRNWAKQALHDAQSDPRWQGENATPAREWLLEKKAR